MGEYIYMTLSIPIFNASSWNKVRRAKTDWQEAQLDVANARRKQHDDALLAVLDYRGYAREVEQLQRKAASDSLAHHLSSRKYEEGMLSVFDLHANTRKACSASSTCTPPRRPCCKAACSCCKAR